MPVVSNLNARVPFSGNPATTALPNPIIASTSFAAQAMPDTLSVITATAAGTVTITLPKIGSQFAPIGKRVTIRKADTHAGVVTITPTTPDQVDSGGAGVTFAAALPVSALNTVTLQATDATHWELVANSVKAI